MGRRYRNQPFHHDNFDHFEFDNIDDEYTDVEHLELDNIDIQHIDVDPNHLHLEYHDPDVRSRGHPVYQPRAERRRDLRHFDLNYFGNHFDVNEFDQPAVDLNHHSDLIHQYNLDNVDDDGGPGTSQLHEVGHLGDAARGRRRQLVGRPAEQRLQCLSRLRLPH